MSTLKGTILFAAVLLWIPACGSDHDGKQPGPPASSVQPQRGTERGRAAPTSDREMTAEEAASIALKKAKGEATPDEIARLQRYIEGDEK